MTGCTQISPRVALRDAIRSTPLSVESSSELPTSLAPVATAVVPPAVAAPTVAPPPEPPARSWTGSNPAAPASPRTLPAGTPSPPTVVPPASGPQEALVAPASQPWSLTLDEAVRVGLGNSTVARVSSGGDVGASSTTAIDPEIAAARARAALAIFDPTFNSALFGNWINQPPSSFFGPGIPEPAQRNEAGLNFGVSKPWLTGAETRVAYNPPLGFLYIPNSTSSSINPLNTANVEFAVRQPLLRGANSEANRAPIRIAQLRTEQSEWDFRQAVMGTVRSISEAYWDLQASRAAVGALDAMLPLMEETVRIEEQRLLAQRSVRADLARTRAQLHSMRQQQAALQSAVVERELRLRNLLGIPPADAWFIVPVSQPTVAETRLDPVAAMNSAVTRRPDLIRQQITLRVREIECLVAKNQTRVQFDATGLYRVSGLGETLGEALGQASGWQYTDWQTGLTLTIPLGRRAARANAEAAQLQLQRERIVLQQALHATGHRIADLVRQIDFTYRQYQEALQRAQETQEWLRGAKLRYENPPPAGDDWLLAALNDYLLALRSQADAAAEVNVQISRYNALLVRMEEAMGTLLDEAQVQVINGSTPQMQPTADVLRTIYDMQLQNVVPQSRELPEGKPQAPPPLSLPAGPPMLSAPTTSPPSVLVPSMPLPPPPDSALSPLPRESAPARPSPLLSPPPFQIFTPKEVAPSAATVETIPVPGAIGPSSTITLPPPPPPPAVRTIQNL
jgi:outer membrane protein TolC